MFCVSAVSDLDASIHLCFFFFQAEDGIRDYKVTGVQTCALPIYGDTTLLCVDKESFHAILATHVEFYDALLRLQAHRIRQTYGLVEDLNTLPLRARLAKQLLHL